MSNLVEHAKRELDLIGEDEDMRNHLVAVVEKFSEFGHSGSSAEHAADRLNDLLRYKALSPLTDAPEEWMDRSEMSGYPIWQNKRDSRAMSHDGGKTYWLVDEAQDSAEVTPKHESQRIHRG